MKKLIIGLSILSTFIISAETYKINISESSYKGRIQVEPSLINVAEVPVEPEGLTCTLPDVMNQAEDACINNIAAVDWIDNASDTCGGMRQANFDSNVYYARSKSNIMSTSLEIPSGFRWVTTTEYTNLFDQSTVPNKSTYIYQFYNQCGLSGYARQNGVVQYIILFSNNGNAGSQAGQSEYDSSTSSGSNHINDNGFLGYILYKEY
jgi:hypothetical protein